MNKKIILWMLTLMCWSVLSWCYWWWWKLAELQAVEVLNQWQQKALMNETSKIMNEINSEDWELNKTNEEIDNLVNEVLNQK